MILNLYITDLNVKPRKMKNLLVPMIVLFFLSGLTCEVQAQIEKDLKKNLGIDKNKKEDPKGYNPEADLIKIGGPFADQGITGEIHKNHIGEIVFATDKIPLEGASQSSFKRSFYLSENIYGRVYMPKSVENYPLYSVQFMRNGDTTNASHNQYGRFYYNIYVDGVKEKYWNVELVDLSKNGLVNTTTYQVWLNPKPEDQKVRDEWKDLINKLSDGEHTIRLDMVAGSPDSYSGAEVVASGEFKIIKGSGETFQADYGKTFDDVIAKMNDADLEAKMLAVAREYAKDNGYKEDFKAVKIANSDWTIIRHEISGAILRRIIDVHCYAVWPDGHCTTQKFVFGQEYNGSEYSKTVKFHGVTFGSYAENLNCN